MNLETVQVKHLTLIEELTKELLLVLSSSELGDDTINKELAVLAIEISNERQLRLKADAAHAVQQARDSANLLPNWDNEGGAAGQFQAREDQHAPKFRPTPIG
jgi:hypothetical protein